VRVGIIKNGEVAGGNVKRRSEPVCGQQRDEASCAGEGDPRGEYDQHDEGGDGDRGRDGVVVAQGLIGPVPPGGE